MKLLKMFFLNITLTFIIFSQPNQQWMATYNGTGNNTDILNDMTIDAAGHIYVTGITRSGSSQTTEDYGTIKYLSNGTRRWIVKYNGPANQRDNAYAVAVDHECNVYVTGRSEGHSLLTDYTTIKYDSAGNQIWLKTFNSQPVPSEWIDIPYDIAVSQTGVFVTGISYIIGYGNYITTVKYGFNGTQMWVSRYQGYYVSDKGISIAADNAGNCFVGVLSDAGSAADYKVIKYNAAGMEEWVATYNGPANAADILTSITLDPSGNVYATGRSYTGTDSKYDVTTVKFSAGGSTDWVARFNGFASMADGGNFIIYGDNAVYVTGYIQQTTDSRSVDMILIKYSLSGPIIWTQYYNSTKNFQDQGVGITVDRNNNVYLTGNSAESNNSGYQVCLIKYSPDGSEQWVKNSGRINTNAIKILNDTSSNIYIAGYGDNFPGNSDYLILKYSSGNLNTNSFSHGSLNKVINDFENTIDVINVNLPQNNPASLIQKVVLVIDSVIHTNDSDLEFYITHNGITDTLIYHAGGTGDNFLNTRLDDSAFTSVENGTAPFAGRFKPVSNLGKFIGQNPNGEWTLRIYDNAAGNTGILQAWHLEITYMPTIGINLISEELPAKYNLHQNYPNPFNPVTKINFDIPAYKDVNRLVKLTIYDILGREITQLVNQELLPGSYSVEWNASNYPSGVYFYSMQTSNYFFTNKMILIK